MLPFRTQSNQQTSHSRPPIPAQNTPHTHPCQPLLDTLADSTNLPGIVHLKSQLQQLGLGLPEQKAHEIPILPYHMITILIIMIIIITNIVMIVIIIIVLTISCRFFFQPIGLCSICFHTYDYSKSFPSALDTRPNISFCLKQAKKRQQKTRTCRSQKQASN